MQRVKRPCDECPWRVDAAPGRFTAERWAALAASSADERGFGTDFASPLFACHKTPEGGERACAGWLAVEGHQHPRVRLDVMLGAIPACALQPGDGWPALHGSFHETRAHDEGSTPPTPGALCTECVLVVHGYEPDMGDDYLTHQRGDCSRCGNVDYIVWTVIE